jgi:excisionase family DNA binding protein
MTERLTLTVSEAAQLLGVSRNSLYEAVRRNEVPHLRIGRRIVIPRRQLENLLDGLFESAGAS